MAKGKGGMYLEGWKFAVYLALPLGASWWFNDPRRQKEAADYWQFVKYPANPNVGMKEQIEALSAQQKQRDVYRDQMKELHAQAARTRKQQEEKEEEKPGWLRWIGLGGRAHENKKDTA
jgi:hypothetical protein